MDKECVWMLGGILNRGLCFEERGFRGPPGANWEVKCLGFGPTTKEGEGCGSEVKKRRAVCHAVPLPAIPPPPSLFSPPCQEGHQSRLRAALQGRNTEPPNGFSVHARTYASRRTDVSSMSPVHVLQSDHPKVHATLTPPHLQRTYSLCVSSKQWVETTNSRSLQGRTDPLQWFWCVVATVCVGG